MTDAGTLIARSIECTSCMVSSDVTVQVACAVSMQPDVRHQFQVLMPPVKINFDFQPERTGRALVSIRGRYVIDTHSRQMRIEKYFVSGWRDQVCSAVEAYRMNGNRQIMGMLPILTAMDLCVEEREEILDRYFEFVMGYTQAQIKSI